MELLSKALSAMKPSNVADDARAVEAAYQALLDAVDQPPLSDESQRDDHD